MTCLAVSSMPDPVVGNGQQSDITKVGLREVRSFPDPAQSVLALSVYGRNATQRREPPRL